MDRNTSHSNTIAGSISNETVSTVAFHICGLWGVLTAVKIKLPPEASIFKQKQLVMVTAYQLGWKEEENDVFVAGKKEDLVVSFVVEPRAACTHELPWKGLLT